MAELKQAWLCSSGLMKTLDFILRFGFAFLLRTSAITELGSHDTRFVVGSRHGITQASLALLIWLNENVGITTDNKKLFPKLPSWS